MATLIYLVALALYAIVGVAATNAVVARAKGHGWLWGSATALAFFLVPFWDLLPTLGAFHYYCGNEARLEVKRPLSVLLGDSRAPAETGKSTSQAPQPGFLRSMLTQRLAFEISSPPQPGFLSVKRVERRVVDIETGAVVARIVDFHSGYAPLGAGGPGAWKVWLRRESCAPAWDSSPNKQFDNYVDAIRRAGRS